MKRIILIAAVVLCTWQLQAQKNYKPSAENLQNRAWFQDAKFGLFVHWGVYSTLAGGGDPGIAEWIMKQKKMTKAQYEKLPSFFNPTGFDPAEWVAMVKKAGMRYITITTKHHDGFAMYNSHVSDYNVVKKTPYAKDIIAALKDECDKQGIKLFFYYSQLDWHHPDYFPAGKTGQVFPDKPTSGNWENYIRYMNTQLTELLSNYGEVGGIWFDGMWDKKDAPWHLSETYQLIHTLQPGTLIGSNHHLSPITGEDFQMFERDLPGENTMGFNQTGTISDLPLEMCETMNGSWGFNIVDTNYKSSKKLIRTMTKAAGYGANFLLNTGPMPNGKIQPENIDTLAKIGEWLAVYGESIYGTRRGPLRPGKWGATTQKGKLVFVHLFDMNGEAITLPPLPNKIKSMRYWDGDDKVIYEQSKTGLTIQVPKDRQQGISTILVLEI